MKMGVLTFSGLIQWRNIDGEHAPGTSPCTFYYLYLTDEQLDALTAVVNGLPVVTNAHVLEMLSTSPSEVNPTIPYNENAGRAIATYVRGAHVPVFQTISGETPPQRLSRLESMGITLDYQTGVLPQEATTSHSVTCSIYAQREGEDRFTGAYLYTHTKQVSQTTQTRSVVRQGGVLFVIITPTQSKRIFFNAYDVYSAQSSTEVPSLSTSRLTVSIIGPSSDYPTPDKFFEYFKGLPGELPDPNEQDPGGPSAPGGGEGNFDDTSDPIPLPDMPSISATDCGLVTAYRPTRQNLLDLGEYLYSPLLDLDTLKKLFDQPMQWLIGLNILPFSPSIGGTKEIKFAAFGTGVTSDYCTQQYHQIDCGEVEVTEYWGSALDYSPNTRAYLWLPFIGFVQVDVDIIMGSTCKVIYRVDILTGACIAVLMVNGSAVNHWTGQCSSNIPLSASDYSRVIGSLLSVAGTAIGSAAAIGGALGALSNAGTAVAGATEAVKGATTAAGAAGANRALDVATTNQSVARGNAASTIAGGVTNTVSNVMGAKLGVQMSGSISGNAGLLDVQKPYFMFIRPRQSLAENYKHYVGYPSNMYASVESCKGYTKFEQIELTGIEATDGEIAEIAQVLKGGFYG